MLHRAIPIFEAQFPGMQALFAFDNATSHAAFADDALCANRMNLGPGGKQHLMRQTTWGNGIYQELVFPEDHAIKKLRGKAKGIKVVLEERGIWRAGLTLDCRVKCPTTELDSCARKIMANQPDFLPQKCMLEEPLVGAGHMIIFYPRFYCELSFIENFWGSAKRYARKHCNYSWTGLKDVVPEALGSVSLTEIRN